MTPLVYGLLIRVRTWRNRGSSPVKASAKVAPRKQGPLSETTPIGAGMVRTISPVSSSSRSRVPRSARRSARSLRCWFRTRRSRSARPGCVRWAGRGTHDAARQPGLTVGPVSARQQQPATPQRPLHRRGRGVDAVGAHHRRDLAMTPRWPVSGVLRREHLDRGHPRRRPRTLHRNTTAQPDQPPAICAFRDAGQSGEPRHRQRCCRSQGLEVFEGT